METTADPHKPEKKQASMRTVVLASSTGTAFEWYDFFIYGALAPVIARNFFSQLDETAGLIASLALFATGFLFRPLGALVFGRLGDRFGRKGAFLATVIIMGGATFAIGLLPTYAQAGSLGTILLIFVRILQGLALGGEYGGAAIYVAEHASAEKRGQSTAWIQASAAFGLLGAQLIVFVTRLQMGEEAFQAWGWRIPFLMSLGLLAVSIWMRFQLSESPEFERAKAENKLTSAPFKEVFLKWSNLKIVLIALLSITGAQGAIWWCTFSYSQIFLESTMKFEPMLTNVALGAATLASIPIYVFFGWLSDRIGRKPVILFGIGLAILAVFPSFHMMARGANPELFAASERAPVEIHADPATCSFQFDILGRARYETACDIARAALTRAGAPYSTVHEPAGGATEVRVGGAATPVADGLGLDRAGLAKATADNNTAIRAALNAAGYPATARAESVNWGLIAAGLVAMVIAACALYGPQAAALVELFPTHVRYTAMSVPYHVGVGWVGGFMPVTAFAIAAAAGDIFAGLWYLIVFAGISFVSCLLVFPETKGRPLDR
jgi:MFS family permease